MTTQDTQGSSLFTDLIHAVDVCFDCVHFIEYGSLPDEERERGRSNGQHGAEMAARWPVDEWRLVNGEGEGSFSWVDCEGCGTSEGGSRYGATALQLRAGVAAPVVPSNAVPFPLQTETHGGQVLYVWYCPGCGERVARAAMSTVYRAAGRHGVYCPGKP